uniref:Ig-like domain-containing protein n=1 Tax=Amphiprion ocellaris TaxID=80972 RepID=A0A3Q1CA78_AMPOC
MLPCSSFKHPHVSPPDVLNVPSVSVSLSAEIMEGSSVTLTCSSDADSAANHTWNKKNQTLVNKSQQLVFSSIQVSDSGDYSCTAENHRYNQCLNVCSCPPDAPKVPLVLMSSSGEIMKGSSVTLTCSSDVNDRDPLSQTPQLNFSSIRSSESGQYSCTNALGNTSSSIYINVKCELQLIMHFCVFLYLLKHVSIHLKLQTLDVYICRMRSD